MRLFKTRLLTIIIFSLLIAVGVNLYCRADKSIQNSPSNSLGTKHEITDNNTFETKSKEKFIVNETSGDVKLLPWENDSNFKNAQKKYATPVLMNAYCAVLNDPLPGEEENVRVGTNLLCGTIVYPEKIFSQNKTIGPYIISKGYSEGPTYNGTHLTTTIGGGVCKIASTLYNTAIKSNMQIIERHEHCMPVSYVPYGQDATVSYGSLDFRFKNNTDSPVLIWSQSVGKALYIGFYGRSMPPKVEWHHEILSTTKTAKIFKINKSLQQHEVKTIVEGMDGAKVRSWITIEYPEKVITKQLGRSTYLPLPYIFEKNP